RRHCLFHQAANNASFRWREYVHGKFCRQVDGYLNAKARLWMTVRMAIAAFDEMAASNEAP
ncbi:MAG: hypothetical protein AAF525_20820, partial [Pseudomonadota bacterium]